MILLLKDYVKQSRDFKVLSKTIFSRKNSEGAMPTLSKRAHYINLATSPIPSRLIPPILGSI